MLLFSKLSIVEMVTHIVNGIVIIYYYLLVLVIYVISTLLRSRASI